MTTEDLTNGLRHTADDHPCCRGTIAAAIAEIESLERENASLREASIPAEVVGFDSSDKTVTLQFGKMPDVKIFEQWFIFVKQPDHGCSPEASATNKKD
jgi:hypothetical protein